MVHGVPGNKLPFACFGVVPDSADGGVVSQRQAILWQRDSNYQAEYSLQGAAMNYQKQAFEGMPVGQFIHCLGDARLELQP